MIRSELFKIGSRVYFKAKSSSFARRGVVVGYTYNVRTDDGKMTGVRFDNCYQDADDIPGIEATPKVDPPKERVPFFRALINLVKEYWNGKEDA